VVAGARAAAARVPAVAWLCAAAALVVTVAWSLVIPPFHVPDEHAHLAYVQQFAETGDLPRDKPESVLPEDTSKALYYTGFFNVIGQTENRPPITTLQDRALQEGIEGAGSTGNGDVDVATAQPPLYYAIEAVPYRAAESGSILTRLSLMRLVTCLLAALTALFATLFVRELLPGTPWAWAVGGLGVAFQPTFGFISAGVNPDGFMFAAAAALFYAVARALRRGLDPATGLAIGAAACAGALGKLTFLGLVPGALAGVALLLAREWRGPNRRPALVGAAAAVLPLVVGIAIYAALNVTVWDRPALGLGAVATVATQGADAPNGSIRGELSYTWQLFLPRLPIQHEYFTKWPIEDIWLTGFVGRFGWLDYGFEPWVYDVAHWVGIAVLLLALVALLRRGRPMLRRLPELAVYTLMAGGVMLVIGHADFPAYLSGGPNFRQARYLLPLLPLYAVLLGLAARAPGRRFGPALGAAIVMAAFAHTLFAQLLTISRFYG
jgi:small subunit ribosomal protein S36